MASILTKSIRRSGFFRCSSSIAAVPARAPTGSGADDSPAVPAASSATPAAFNPPKIPAPNLLVRVVYEADHIVVFWSEGFQSTFNATWLWMNQAAFFQPGSGQRLAVDISRAPTIQSVKLYNADSTDANSMGVEVAWSDGTSSPFTRGWLQKHDYSAFALRKSVGAALTQPLKDRGPPISPTAAVSGHAEAGGTGEGGSSTGASGAAPSSRKRPIISGSTAGGATRPLYHGVGREDVAQFEYKSIMKSDNTLLAWLRAINKDGLALVRGAPLAERTVLGLAGRIAAPMRTIYGEVWNVEVMPTPINISYSPV